MVVGYQRKVAQSELATVTTSYHAGDDKGFSGRWYATDRLPGEGLTHPPAIGKSFTMPSTITHFFNSDSGAQWHSVVDQVWTYPDGNQDILGEFRGPWTEYQAGRSYTETWNHAVFGPTFPSPGSLSTGVTRTGDTIGVDLPLYGDGAGRDGCGGDSGSVALYRDAVKIGEQSSIGGSEFTVPAGDATYRLQVHAERGVPYALSTAIDAAWTFRSAHVDGDQPAKLPLWAVRFSPALDDNNAAPAGRSLSVPVIVTPQPGARTGQLRNLVVDVSYDDGATWTPASIQVRPDGAIASLELPMGNGFVSLRATAGDSDGNSVEQIIVHAFRYGRTG
jgi:hypothetical protein